MTVAERQTPSAGVGATVFALSSGVGKGGVAVVRMSGPDALSVAGRLCGRLPPPREIRRARIRAPETGELLDHGMVVQFPGPASFTGEDVVEFHLHGGGAVLAAVLSTLGAQRGLRLADPGEFTRRAFEAGKLDLTEAEGLADLVMAETDAQRRQALLEMEGHAGAQYRDWGEQLLTVLSHLEAAIDFSDEELPDGLVEGACIKIEGVLLEVVQYLERAKPLERVRDGVTVALVGAPNVGKSTLMNRIAGRDVAIVSPEAGTTRDVLECQIELGGFPIRLFDLAGLRSASSEVEQEGVRRARARALSADLRILVRDGSAEDRAGVLIEAQGVDEMILYNKSDLGPPNVQVEDIPSWKVSALTGAGMEEFLRGLQERVSRKCAAEGAGMLVRARHREALRGVENALRRGVSAGQIDLVAEDVREAVRAFGVLTGAVRVDDVLDRIFGEFCLGK